jgi:hypothetical protein
MASAMIGRTTCPECGFSAAHVKQKEEKENAKPYRHCTECGAQYFPRNKQQADMLIAKTRAQKLDADPAPAPEPAPADPAPAPAPVPAVKYKTVLGVRVPV